MKEIKVLEGKVVAPEGMKVGIVASRFNEIIVNKLLGGAVDGLVRHGVEEENITAAWVPGAFEIPVAASAMAKSGKYDAIICVGAVIRGDTTHYDYVCSEVSKGIAQVGLAEKMPVLFGVLTTENIEQAIAALQQNATPELLAHALTAIRRRIRENGQFVVAVEPNPGTTQMSLKVVPTPDGRAWWYAFTSFEEEMRGAEQVQSTFMADIGKLLETALTVPEIEGIILNPWHRTLMLDKTLIQIILPESPVVS